MPLTSEISLLLPLPFQHSVSCPFARDCLGSHSAQALWRVSKDANECPSHPLRVGEADMTGDNLDGFNAPLDPNASHFCSQTLYSLGRGLAGFG
jgi:hypothetical protein